MCVDLRCGGSRLLSVMSCDMQGVPPLARWLLGGSYFILAPVAHLLASRAEGRMYTAIGSKIHPNAINWTLRGRSCKGPSPLACSE